MERLLILTHSDASTDSRIIKTHEVCVVSGRQTLSIGVVDPEPGQISKSTKDVFLIKNRIRDFRDALAAKPKAGSFFSKLFFIAIYLELAIKMLTRGIAFRPQVIHCNDWFVLPIAAVIKFLTKSKLIYDDHELESQTTNDPNFPSLFIERLERFLWPSIDYLITVSPSIETWYQTEMGPKPSEVILNSPVFSSLSEINNGKTDRSYLRKKYGLSDSTTIYLYIGMLSVGRGIEIILDAFDATKTNSAVIFLGYGNYRERIETQGLKSKNVFVHDRVPHGQVVGIARNADFGLCLIENVSLSDYFCIPNKLLEYAFSGIPVVASKLPEIKRVVDEYQLGQCFDNSVEQLMEVLTMNEKKPVVKRSNDKDLFPLSWEAQAIKLEAVLDEVTRLRTGVK
jgi:glycosyltransferase involved in cell wall biosynthesis